MWSVAIYRFLMMIFLVVPNMCLSVSVHVQIPLNSVWFSFKRTFSLGKIDFFHSFIKALHICKMNIEGVLFLTNLGSQNKCTAHIIQVLTNIWMHFLLYKISAKSISWTFWLCSLLCQSPNLLTSSFGTNYQLQLLIWGIVWI